MPLQTQMKARRSITSSIGLTLGLVLIASGIFFSSCKWLSSNSNSVNSSTPGNHVRVTLRLPWLFNIESAGILTAKEKGLYAAKGIDLQILPGGIGLNPAQLVGGGSEDIGIIDGAGFVIARAKGLPIKALAAEYQKSPFCYVTLKDSGLTTIEQFRGKRVGTQNISIYVLEIALASRNMTLSDVKMVPVQFDASPLINKQVDAYLGFVTDQPISLSRKGIQTNVIPLSDYGYALYGNVIFAKESTIQANPTLVKGFLDATFEGWKLAFQDVPGTVAMIKEKYNKELDPEQQRLGLEKLKEIMTDNVGLDHMGQMDQGRWSQSVDLLLKYRQIEKSVPAQEATGDLGYVRK